VSRYSQRMQSMTHGMGGANATLSRSYLLLGFRVRNQSISQFPFNCVIISLTILKRPASMPSGFEIEHPRNSSGSNRSSDDESVTIAS
jgi:hypothetical protein